MSAMGFDGKVAIITGGGGGLGSSHARLLASRGACVVVNDVGGDVHGLDAGVDTPAQRVVDEIRASGGEAVADFNTVSTLEGGEALVQTAVDTFGRVDIVINNAGILRDKSFHKLDDDALRSVLEVHLLGAFNVTRPAWIRMREQGYGRVVSTTSAAGLFGNFGQTNYAAAKMGLVGFTKALAAEGARTNLKANVIAPIARTRMTEDVLGRFVERLDPALVSPVVAVLAHEDCPVTGQVYSAGGGRVSRAFVGLTSGVVFDDGPLAPEDVLAALPEIDATAEFVEPRDATDEIRSLRKALHYVDPSKA